MKAPSSQHQFVIRIDLSRKIPKDKDVLLSYSVAIFIPSETENLKQNPYRVLTNLQLTYIGFFLSNNQINSIQEFLKAMIQKPRLCNQFFDTYKRKVKMTKLSFF